MRKLLETLTSSVQSQKQLDELQKLIHQILDIEGDSDFVNRLSIGAGGSRVSFSERDIVFTARNGSRLALSDLLDYLAVIKLAVPFPIACDGTVNLFPNVPGGKAYGDLDGYYPAPVLKTIPGVAGTGIYKPTLNIDSNGRIIAATANPDYMIVSATEPTGAARYDGVLWYNTTSNFPQPWRYVAANNYWLGNPITIPLTLATQAFGTAPTAMRSDLPILQPANGGVYLNYFWRSSVLWGGAHSATNYWTLFLRAITVASGGTTVNQVLNWNTQAYTSPTTDFGTTDRQVITVNTYYKDLNYLRLDGVKTGSPTASLLTNCMANFSYVRGAT